jgi:hypothetical protein
MSQQIQPYISPQEYLRLERLSEYKSEYVNGQIFAMTGASRKHNLITTNISGELSQQLKGRPFEVYAAEIRVKVRANGLYTYPDVAVACGEPEFEDDFIDTLLNPVVSRSAVAYHRATIASPSLLTIERWSRWLSISWSPRTIRAEQYVKQPNGECLLFNFSPSTAPSIFLRLLSSVERGYDRISFEPTRRVPG